LQGVQDGYPFGFGDVGWNHGENLPEGEEAKDFCGLACVSS
jgi:hypothetical protein